MHIWKTTEENFLSVPASVIFFVLATLSVAIDVRYYVCTHIWYVYLYNMNIFSCDVSIALSSWTFSQFEHSICLFCSHVNHFEDESRTMMKSEGCPHVPYINVSSLSRCWGLEGRCSHHTAFSFSRFSSISHLNTLPAWYLRQHTYIHISSGKLL